MLKFLIEYKTEWIRIDWSKANEENGNLSGNDIKQLLFGCLSTSI